MAINCDLLFIMIYFYSGGHLPLPAVHVWFPSDGHLQRWQSDTSGTGLSSVESVLGKTIIAYWARVYFIGQNDIDLHSRWVKSVSVTVFHCLKEY